MTVVILSVLVFAVLLPMSFGWAPKVKANEVCKKIIPLVPILSIGLAIQPVQLSNAAQILGTMKAERVESINGDGGVDAIGAAFNQKNPKMTALSDTPYKRAQAGEIPLADGPRALKRRAYAACKNDKSRQEFKISTKECINKVMTNDQDFIKQIGYL